MGQSRPCAARHGVSLLDGLSNALLLVRNARSNLMDFLSLDFCLVPPTGIEPVFAA